MAAATVLMSPGIYAKEINNSQYVSILTSTILAIVTPASQGPTDTATFCATYTDLVNIFGYPAAAYPGMQVARDFFYAGGNQCWIVRVAQDDVAAAFALPLVDGNSVTVPAATTGSGCNNVQGVISYADQKQDTYATAMSLVLFNRETVTITGSTWDAGDTVSVTVTNSGIVGSPVTATYTLLSTDTTVTKIATGLAAAINSNILLAAANVSATSSLGVVTISAPTTLGSVTYAVSDAPGTGNETVTLNSLHMETATITGSTFNVSDTLSLTFANGGITGSPVTVTYTVIANDTPTTCATALSGLINANANLTAAGISSTHASGVITILAPAALGSVTYTEAVTGTGDEVITIAAGVNHTEKATVAGTKIVADDTVALTFTNGSITGSPLTVTYTVVDGDTPTDIAAGLVSLINANSNLNSASISATSSLGVVTILAPVSLGAVVYDQTVTYSEIEGIVAASGASNQPAPQTISVPLYDTATNGETIALTGTVTVGDVLSVTFANVNIQDTPVTVSYTVLTGDNLSTIAAALNSRINAHPDLNPSGISSTVNAHVVTIEALKSLGTVVYTSNVTGAQTEIITLGALTGNVKNNPIVPGTLDVTVNGSGGTITDDAKGGLIFTPASCGIAGTVWSGSINYGTGVMTIKVTGASVASSPSLVPTFSYYQSFTLQLYYLLLNQVTGGLINRFPLQTYTRLTPTNFQATLSNSTYIGTIAGSTLSAFPQAGVYQFVGGTDGTAGLTDANYVGVQGNTPTGMQQFAYPDQIDINTFCVPGKGGSVAVMEAGIQLVTQSRTDTIFLAAPPASANSTQQAVAWANGQGQYVNFGVIDNSYTALYYPWYMTYNSSNGAFEPTPPEAAAVIAFAQSDWYEAPAGFNRGMVPNATSLPILHQGDRDFLYWNRINPISNLQNMGIMVSGQKTATLVPSSLDRIGARKVLCRLEKAVVTAVFPLLFELDNPLTWKRAEDIVQPLLDHLTTAQILRGGKIQCDSQTNTAYSIANNQMIVNITLLLPKYAEFIVLNFIINETGLASISESLVPQLQGGL